jgi:hypothetical protein
VIVESAIGSLPKHFYQMLVNSVGLETFVVEEADRIALRHFFRISA